MTNWRLQHTCTIKTYETYPGPTHSGPSGRRHKTRHRAPKTNRSKSSETAKSTPRNRALAVLPRSTEYVSLNVEQCRERSVSYREKATCAHHPTRCGLTRNPLYSSKIGPKLTFGNRDRVEERLFDASLLDQISVLHVGM